MLTKFYAANEINFPGNINVPAGELIGTLETPDNVPVDNVVRALNNGLATRNPPAPKQAAPIAPPQE